jgi:hypothetical protein
MTSCGSIVISVVFIFALHATKPGVPSVDTPTQKVIHNSLRTFRDVADDVRRLKSGFRAASTSSGGTLATILPFCYHDLMQAGRPSKSCKPAVRYPDLYNLLLAQAYGRIAMQ